MQTVNVFNRGLAVVTSDTVNIPLLNNMSPTSLYVGGAGIVVAVFEDGTTANFTAVAGEILPLRIRRVNATTTTATLMVALYQV